ncbi:MAG: formimidoylglutamase [Bacillota bacterium]
MYYKKPSEKFWTGRIDSEKNEDKFRFHQKINLLDYKEISTIKKDKKNIYIAFIGFSSDLGVERNKGIVGASEAPDTIRKKLSSKPFNYEKVKIYDLGNIIVHENLREAQLLLSNIVKKLINKNIFPIILGGGHETSYGAAVGLIKSIDKNKKINTLNFDAHFDMRDLEKLPTSGTMFSELLNRYNNYYYSVFGIQKIGNTKHLFKKADKLNRVNYYLVDKIIKNDFNLLKSIKNDPKTHYHLTICFDVFTSKEVPGVSSPNIKGITYAQMNQYLEKLILNLDNLKVFDLSEMNPKMDINNLSINVAVNIIYDIINYLEKKYIIN